MVVDSSDATAPPDVIVRGNAAGFAQVIEVGSHRLATDEPDLRAALSVETRATVNDCKLLLQGIFHAIREGRRVVGVAVRCEGRDHRPIIDGIFGCHLRWTGEKDLAPEQLSILT